MASDAHRPTGRIARVIDFETTGLPEDDDPEVVEMGSIDVRLDTREVMTGSVYSSFACPRRPIPPQARAVHHISDADVQEFPQARELWDMFFSDMTGDDILVAHNARMEQHFHEGDGRPWICTYKVARVVWPDAPGHSNQCLRYWLGLDLDEKMAWPPHRALPDAYVTAHLFVRLLEHKTPDEMIKISQYPALIKVMNFGKHKGMTFAEAPTDYLEFIRDKSSLSEDTKFSARYWLKKRRDNNV